MKTATFQQGINRAKQKLRPHHSIARETLSGADLARLFLLMQGWWQGKTLAMMAAEHGISVQRVGRLLARVGCTARLWRKVKDAPKDHPRSAQPSQLDEAIGCLLDPMAWQLTPRQRCALAWVAQGLTTVNAAHRMGTTGQGVRYFLVRAKERLGRLVLQAAIKQMDWRPKREPKPAAAMLPFNLDCSEVDAILAQTRPIAPSSRPDATA
ncbi:MAG: helix-turn-helix transcriptional regulator [Planctomycetota bacterium]